MTATNWDQELKRIEREFVSGSADPIIKLDNSRAAAEKHAKERRKARNAAIGVWIRLLLVISLAVGINFWPYAQSCGVGLYAYMGAAGFVGAGAVWAAVSSWQSRLPWEHGLSMLMLLVALALLASEILPRVGYARVDAANPPRWGCVAAPKT